MKPTPSVADCARNVLIVNPFGIGDVLFTLPVLENLKLRDPACDVTCLTNNRSAEVVRRHPLVREVMLYERDDFLRLWRRSKIAYWRELDGLIRTVRDKGFDAVFDFSMNASFGFLLERAGIPARIGYNHKGRGRWLTASQNLPGFEGRHVIDHHLDLLRAAGWEVGTRRFDLRLDENEKAFGHRWLQDRGIAHNGPVIAMVPGGGASWGADASVKRWPVGSFADLADKLVEKQKANIILLGGRTDMELCRELERCGRHSYLNACSTASLIEFSSISRLCDVVILNDGGPLHLAVSASARTVSVFGPVDPAVYGPYGDSAHHIVITQERLACRPCYHRFRRAQCNHISCLTRLETDPVYAAALALLDGGR